MPTKGSGGLGIEVFDIKNKCLISKWLFKLLHEEGVWQELLTNKYLRDKSLSQVEAKPTDSPFWKGLMKVKGVFFSCGSFIMGNGQRTRFWEDTWLGETSLSTQYPMLYKIVSSKNVTASQILSQNPLNISFRRLLSAENGMLGFILLNA